MQGHKGLAILGPLRTVWKAILAPELPVRLDEAIVGPALELNFSLCAIPIPSPLFYRG